MSPKKKPDSKNKSKVSKPKEVHHRIINDGYSETPLRVDESVFRHNDANSYYKLYQGKGSDEIAESELFERTIKKAGKRKEMVVPSLSKKKDKRFVGYYYISERSTYDVDNLRKLSEMVIGKFHDDRSAKYIFIKGWEGDVIYSRQENPGLFLKLEGGVVIDLMSQVHVARMEAEKKKGPKRRKTHFEIYQDEMILKMENLNPPEKGKIEICASKPDPDGEILNRLPDTLKDEIFDEVSMRYRGKNGDELDRLVKEAMLKKARQLPPTKYEVEQQVARTIDELTGPPSAKEMEIALFDTYLGGYRQKLLAVGPDHKDTKRALQEIYAFGRKYGIDKKRLEKAIDAYSLDPEILKKKFPDK